MKLLVLGVRPDRRRAVRSVLSTYIGSCSLVFARNRAHAAQVLDAYPGGAVSLLGFEGHPGYAREMRELRNARPAIPVLMIPRPAARALAGTSELLPLERRVLSREQPRARLRRGTVSSLRYVAGSASARLERPTYAGTSESDVCLNRLTRRQIEVLSLVQRGKSNKQIARVLGVAVGTVKVHCMAIYREIGVANRTEAALWATSVFSAGQFPRE